MSKSPHRWMVILLCVNALLLTAIVVSHVGLPQAMAQVRPYDYILVPGKIRADRQSVWIIDLGTGRLTVCMYNKQSNSIEFGDVIQMPQ